MERLFLGPRDTGSVSKIKDKMHVPTVWPVLLGSKEASQKDFVESAIST